MELDNSKDISQKMKIYNCCNNCFPHNCECCASYLSRCCCVCIPGKDGKDGKNGKDGKDGKDGKPGDLNATTLNFCFSQLAHLIEQIIAFYPTNLISIYTAGLSPNKYTGTPYQLYSSPDSTCGGLFVIKDDDEYGAIPLNSITAIDLGSGSVYNPAITYLSPPTFPQGFDTNIVKAIHDYLPISTYAQIYMGSLLSSSGAVYKNEYGIIVQCDSLGNEPAFIPVLNIEGIVTQIDSSDISNKKNIEYGIKVKNQPT